MKIGAKVFAQASRIILRAFIGGMNMPEDRTDPKYSEPEETYARMSGHIFNEELEWINIRRKKLEIKNSEGQDAVATKDNLIGLALSGGGIRSATFSLGVMQALAKHDLMKYVDILSTVSGGGYIGSTLSWLTSGQAGNSYNFSTNKVSCGPNDLGFPFGDDDPQGGRPSPASMSPAQKMLHYLCGHGNYLTPGKGLTIFTGLALALVLRGTFLNLLVWMPIVAVVWLAGMLVHQEWFPGFEIKGVADIIVWIAKTASIIIAGLFALACIAYSLMTVRSHDIDRYKWRRRFEKIAGGLIKLLLFGGAVALLPWTMEVFKELAFIPNGASFMDAPIAYALSWGGPGYIVLAVIAGYFGIKKSDGTVFGGFVSKGFYGLALVLVLLGLGISTYQIADWAYKDNMALFSALLVVSLVTGWWVNVNYISLHRFYRDRLMETFMPDEKVFINNETGPATIANKARLSTFTNEYGPYHILNTNLILVNSDNELYNERNGDNFILSPLYCGGNATGWRETKSFMGDRLTMATSVAISGAAANPNGFVGGEGLTINPVVGFLMALLNIRLGNWVPHPRNTKLQNKRPNHFRPGGYEILKLFGHNGYKETRNFLELSDGGHFENNAFYELIRRRAKLIICCDGGADPDFSFGDYLTGTDRVKTDFRVTINITPKELEKIVPHKEGGFPKEVKLADRGYAMGTIDYPADGNNGEETTGTLILLKTTMVDGLSNATLKYRGEHTSFPDETTGDQFFSVDQFEAYRDLGYKVGQSAIASLGLKNIIHGIYFPQPDSPAKPQASEPGETTTRLPMGVLNRGENE